MFENTLYSYLYQILNDNFKAMQPFCVEEKNIILVDRFKTSLIDRLNFNL